MGAATQCRPPPAPARARRGRQRLQPRAAGAAAPRVSAKLPGSGGPCAPGPAPRPPALPWLQPGPGRLRLDSARATRGRSCAPTSPHRRPPPATPRADSLGAGPAAGAGRGGACTSAAREPARAEPGAVGLSVGLAARDPRRQGAARRSGRASLVIWLSLSPSRVACPGGAALRGLEPVPKEKGRAHLAPPREAFGRRGEFAPWVGEKQLPRRVHKVCGNCTDRPYPLYTS